MENNDILLKTLKVTDLVKDAGEYLTDAVQRSIIFLDILRKRGDNFFQTIRQGEPPVLIFGYQVIHSGTDLERPVNYDLSRITPSRSQTIDPTKRPIVVIDPRAGNGPGIGGFKQDSEIGDALEQGHPVYFILFHPEPVPGQTLEDVERAQEFFIQEVATLHPHAEKPAVIGNCQAGWAVALLGADRPDLTGPLVLNGTPLSYWSGVEGRNPLRYLGGLLGGVWIADFLSDLGNGKFDGAWLEENFESVHPANTLWTKQYYLYSHVDTEEDRYLNFEKWWDGYSEMTKEEIHAILAELFVGDELEQGKLKLDRKKILNLKNITKPLVLFCSEGDNITPPQQALDWIIKEYRSVDEIKKQKRVIVYMIDQRVGHLGIFVGTKTGKKEHREIIKNIDLINRLSPGLYEMIIIDKGKKEGISDYDTRFEPRDIADIAALNEGREEIREETADFSRAKYVSEMNSMFYNTFISPWVAMFVNEDIADFLKDLHPLRVSKYVFSDWLNPFMLSFKYARGLVEENRWPVSKDNPYAVMEYNVSNTIVSLLESYQKVRDHAEESMFFSIYGNPLAEFIQGKVM